MFRIKYLYFVLTSFPKLLKGDFFQDSLSNFSVLLLFKCSHSVKNMTACFLDFPDSVPFPIFFWTFSNSGQVNS